MYLTNVKGYGTLLSERNRH
jgi:hypothetical protein